MAIEKTPERTYGPGTRKSSAGHSLGSGATIGLGDWGFSSSSMNRFYPI